MKDLENLIIRLQKGIDKKHNYIKTIRDPYMLIKSLKELNDMIGNDNIKESVSKQISYLILEKSRGSSNDVMLNTVLFGSAGVGKTEISTKLAKIWYSLGFLKTKQAPPAFNFDQFKPEIMEDQSMFNLFLFLLFIWVIALTWNFYTSYGSLLTVVLVISLIIVVFAIYYNANKTPKPICKTDQCEYKPIKDDDIIKVVSRDDFVGLYVGSSAPKTKKLLEDNLGKVLFVDEAYSLINHHEDSFGMEALTTLNLFMSQHPNEIIIIFAGYKELLNEGPFKAQSGLARRFMWQFECEGYSAEELYDIFKFKMDKKKWELKDVEEIKNLFKKYHANFKNQGGDVEKLCFFSCLEHADDYLENPDIGLRTLNLNQVQKGVDRLITNSTATTCDSSDKYQNYMDMIKKDTSISDLQELLKRR